MPRKNTMRDNVNAVRSRLPYLSDLSREKLEIALLYYESNVDATVEAFERNGAIEALGGWTEMHNGRGNSSGKRTANNRSYHRNTQPLTLNTTSPIQTPSSNSILRPSQRVSNIFQTFAEGGIPSVITNGSTTISNTTTATCSPSSIASSSFAEPFDNNLQSNSYPIPDSITNNAQVTATNDIIPEEPIEQQKPPKTQRRRSIKNRNSSTSSMTQNHEPPNHQQTTVTKSSNSSTFSNNKKLLAKSVKDLQRQTSTLANVEVLFNNEIKSSLKRIDDIFKQIYEVIKEREVQLYLEMDKAKEQGLNVIRRRQQRAVELRQRIDRCDRLEPAEMDNLRHDIKQFVTDRRYELGEELTSSHRFEYDQVLIDAMRNFGTVLKIDRRQSISTTSPLLETTTTDQTPTKSVSDITPDSVPVLMTNGRTPSLSSSSNDNVLNNNQQEQQPLPQRIHNTHTQSNDEVVSTPTNNSATDDHPQNSYPSSPAQTSRHVQYYDETNNYQNGNRRRTPQNFQRPRPLLNYENDNYRRNTPKQINGRSNMYNNSEPANTYRRPRPSAPPRSIVPVQT